MEARTAKSLAEPLLRGSRRRNLPIGPIFVIAFVNTAANVITLTPALCLQFQDLAIARGMDAAATATAYGSLTALRSVVELTATPAVAIWSDQVGRKKVLCLCCAACLIEGVLLATARSLESFSMIHIGCGILASHSAIEGSSIIDATQTPTARAVAFERLFLVLGFAIIIGPALSGELASRNRIFPFVMAASLSGAGLVYGLVSMPEYLPKSRRRTDSVVGVVPSLRSFTHLLAEDARLACYTCAYALSGLGLSAFISMRTLWAYHTFDWDGREIGRVAAIYGVTLIAAHFVLLPLMLWFMQGREALLAQFCLLVFTARFASYGVASSPSTVYAALILSTAGICSIPVLQGLCSRCLTEDKQGLFSGGASALNTFTQVVGSLIGSRLYAASLSGSVCSNAHLLFSSVCFTLAAAVIMPVQFANARKVKSAPPPWLKHAEGMHGMDATLPSATSRGSMLLRPKKWTENMGSAPHTPRA